MGKLDDFLGSNVGGVVQGAAAQGISMIGQNQRSKKAHERNLEYMDIQNQNQQGLNTQQYGYQRALNQMGHDLQYDMWNKTNYESQVEHMKKAGLNPALMYGTPGQGGSTGSQGGGSAQGGSASGASAPSIQPMDMQNLMIGAQIANLNANTKKTEAEAENEAGGVRDNLTQETKKKLAETTKLKTENDILEFEEKIKKAEADRTEKGMIKGDHLGNLLEAVGLDPVNNEGDRMLLNTMLTTWYGSKVAGELMGSIPGLKELRGLLKGKSQVGY
jgi:hypothetical protein